MNLPQSDSNVPVRGRLRPLAMGVIASLSMLVFSSHAFADDLTPGARPSQVFTPSVLSGSTAIAPVVTESGLISLSVDGMGTVGSTGIIQVDKPAGATVRGAYMAAVSTGFLNHVIPDGNVMIEGIGVSWDLSTSTSINSWNHWADVTGIVQPIVDAAPAGLIDLTITEVGSSLIDGEVLAVIFDDPNQTTVNTVVLMFGAQHIAGDTFSVAFANPLDLSDPNLQISMSLGISFGFQTQVNTVQVNLIDVNGMRMTSSAGGQDDAQGTHANGALLTVGGIGDTIANPPPFAAPSGPTAWRTDDELYDLMPFVNDGDTTLTVFTINPSNDDNIFFAALNVTSAVAIVGEGILLSPLSAENPVGTSHTVTATLQDDNGDPIDGRLVTFEVLAGPHAGLTDTDTSDANGQASFTYVGTSVGTDTIVAWFIDSQGDVETSNVVTKTWTQPTGEDCVYSQGFWKNHPDDWPVDQLQLGEVVYTQAELLSILDQPVRGNGLLSLSKQLIAALLNQANGASATAEVQQAISDAHALIGGLVVPPVGKGHLHPSATSALTSTLDDYNNGLLGTPHCDD